MDSELLLFNCPAPRRPCVPSLISCITALPSIEWFTGVTVVEDIWPVICMIEKDKWLSPIIDLFMLSRTIPEKDFIREGDMDSPPPPGKFLGKTTLIVHALLENFFLSTFCLLGNCSRQWRRINEQRRQNPGLIQLIFLWERQKMGWWIHKPYNALYGNYCGKTNQSKRQRDYQHVFRGCSLFSFLNKISFNSQCY